MPNKNKKTSYQIAPSPKLLQKIGATNLTLADAIAEIVANSFDGATDGERTIVEVTVKPDQVLVVDNGVGMTEEVLVEAVKLGVDMSDVVQKKQSNKGRFGLGMKTACASMGHWWAVYTRPFGHSTEYRVVFDLNEWERRSDSAASWKVDIEELTPDTSGPLGNRAHGTAVIVQRLRTKDPMAGAVLGKLGESFKPHLEQGDQILINGDPAVPHEYDFVPGSTIPIEIAFGPKDEYKITGWVAIDKQTHNDGQYGFNIYRSDQLVQTWNQDWFSGHLMTSRIIGEVHMDFIDATFFKQGLQQSDLWQNASVAMKEFMKPIVAASRDLSRKGHINSTSKRSEIINDMREVIGLEPATLDSAPESPTDGSGTSVGRPPTSQSPELLKIQIEAKKLVLENGTRVSISRVETSMGHDGPPFDYIDDDGDPVGLMTVVNSDHPLFAKSKDLNQLGQVAVADSILRYLVARCEFKSDRAVEIRNEWLIKSTENGKDGTK